MGVSGCEMPNNEFLKRKGLWLVYDKPCPACAAPIEITPRRGWIGAWITCPSCGARLRWDMGRRLLGLLLVLAILLALWVLFRVWDTPYLYPLLPLAGAIAAVPLITRLDRLCFKKGGGSPFDS